MDISNIFSARGRGSPRRQEAAGVGFLLKIPGGGGGVLPGGGGRGAGRVSAGNFGGGGGGPKYFFCGPKCPPSYKSSSPRPSLQDQLWREQMFCFFFLPSDFSTDFAVVGFLFSSFLWEEVPRKILFIQKRRWPQNFVFFRTPTHMSNGIFMQTRQ